MANGSRSDFKELRKLQWKIMEDVAASALIPLMRIGDELDLFKKLDKFGPITSEHFANKANIDERYAREWLLALAASGYISFSKKDKMFFLSAEQVAVFADEDSPALMIGAYDLLDGTIRNQEKIRKAFVSGQGVEWSDLHPCVFKGTARFFKPSYAVNLIQKWIPKVTGIVNKLEEGGSFADVGCGYGASSLMVADAFPNCKVYGFDIHGPSIKYATEMAKTNGFGSRVIFQETCAQNYKGKFDVIAFFDCLHDMGDPVGAAKHAFSCLNDEGVIMLIEPMAEDDEELNFNTIGQMYYSFSTMACVPASKSENIGLALGAQAGPKKLINVFEAAGFSACSVVHKTATNMVIEIRK